MVSVIPFNTDNTYLAREFLMKDPYKNARMYSLLENDRGNSLIIYDGGVIRGILAVDENKMEMWFYGNARKVDCPQQYNNRATNGYH